MSSGEGRKMGRLLILDLVWRPYLLNLHLLHDELESKE